MNMGTVWYQEKKVGAERVEGTSSYIFKEVQVVLLPGQFSFDDSRGGYREDICSVTFFVLNMGKA